MSLRLLVALSSTLAVIAPAVPPGPASVLDANRDQTPPTSPRAFARVSIEPARGTGAGRSTARWTPDGGFVAKETTLRELVAFAWQRHPFERREVAGGPSWIDAERFDVEMTGTTPHAIEPDGTLRRSLEALRQVLAARFGLRIREEHVTRPVYLLTRPEAAPRGPQLRPSDGDCRDMMKPRTGPSSPDQRPRCAVKTIPGRIIASTITLAALATLLSPHLDRPVVDATGLPGLFDIELEADGITAPPTYVPGPSDLALPPAAGPPIADAVQQQLGLRLQAASAPMVVVHIEAASRPLVAGPPHPRR